MARGGWGFDCSLPVAIFDRWLIGSGGRRRGLICIHECESVAPASWSGGGGGGEERGWLKMVIRLPMNNY